MIKKTTKTSFNIIKYVKQKCYQLPLNIISIIFSTFNWVFKKPFKAISEKIGIINDKTTINHVIILHKIINRFAEKELTDISGNVSIEKGIRNLCNVFRFNNHEKTTRLFIEKLFYNSISNKDLGQDDGEIINSMSIAEVICSVLKAMQNHQKNINNSVTIQQMLLCAKTQEEKETISVLDMLTKLNQSSNIFIGNNIKPILNGEFSSYDLNCFPYCI